MQFIDLLLVRWIFGRQIGHKNYEDFEHPTQDPKRRPDKKEAKQYKTTNI